MNRKTRIVTLGLAALFSAMGLIAFAGDLNPPVGPVAPTHKTLTEVEPRTAVNAANTPGDADSLFKITQPGSYYLTGNITGVIGKHGIEIAASGVTLDFNGFELLGVAGSLNGVNATVVGLMNIAVRAGSVRNWGGDGVVALAVNCRLSDLLASGNAVRGIVVSTGGTVWNCAAYQNTGNGIALGNGGTVSNCAAYLNATNGIGVSNGCAVLNCAAYQNTGTGISTSSGCVVSNCSAYDNGGNGITAVNGCTVVDCSARANTLDGIVCASVCVIRGSASSSNADADIHATGSDNRIDGNNCTGADRGIDVDAAGNFIIRNTCSGNTTNWDVAAGNVCLVVQGVAGAAILGDTGGAAPGSTDPNANFTY